MFNMPAVISNFGNTSEDAGLNINGQYDDGHSTRSTVMQK